MQSLLSLMCCFTDWNLPGFSVMDDRQKMLEINFLACDNCGYQLHFNFHLNCFQCSWSFQKIHLSSAMKALYNIYDPSPIHSSCSCECRVFWQIRHKGFILHSQKMGIILSIPLKTFMLRCCHQRTDTFDNCWATFNYIKYEACLFSHCSTIPLAATKETGINRLQALSLNSGDSCQGISPFCATIRQMSAKKWPCS